MATTVGRRSDGVLDAALDVFRMRQYFDVIVRARDLATAIRKDATFLDTVRRGFLPLPFDRRPAPGHVFGPLRGAVPPPLPGRVGVVATGGSGALASLVGVAKALEDSGTEVSVYSVCSGSALFGFPLGAGMSPDEVAELTASMRPGDYIDAGWREIAALIPTLARGWCGILRGDKLEAFYRGHFGDLTLAQLRTPTYAPIWNVEHNRLDFVGPRTHPAMPVARAIRMAVSLPLFVQPAVLDGLSWCDGGIVDIFPVRPVLDIEPAVETAVAVNCFYPHDFGGEDITGLGRPAAQHRLGRLAGAHLPAGGASPRAPRQAPPAGPDTARRARSLRQGRRDRLLRAVPRHPRVAGVHARRARGDAHLPAPARSPISRVTPAPTCSSSAGTSAGRVPARLGTPS